MSLDLFNNVFLLNFSLEAAEGIFQWFSLLHPDFGQIQTPPNPSRWTLVVCIAGLNLVKPHLALQSRCLYTVQWLRNRTACGFPQSEQNQRRARVDFESTYVPGRAFVAAAILSLLP